MAASAGIAKFVKRDGQTIQKQIYFDDTVAPVRWDVGAGAGATSPTQLIADQDLALVDVIINAATTKTQTQIIRPDGIPDMIVNAMYLASVAVRTGMTIVYPRGSAILMNQVA